MFLILDVIKLIGNIWIKRLVDIFGVIFIINFDNYYFFFYYIVILNLEYF